MFSDDVELIYMNSAQYNGAQSAFTATAFKMLQVCKVALQEVWYPELQKFEKFWNENLINWSNLSCGIPLKWIGFHAGGATLFILIFASHLIRGQLLKKQSAPIGADSFLY